MSLTRDFGVCMRKQVSKVRFCVLSLGDCFYWNINGEAQELLGLLLHEFCAIQVRCGRLCVVIYLYDCMLFVCVCKWTYHYQVFMLFVLRKVQRWGVFGSGTAHLFVGRCCVCPSCDEDVCCSGTESPIYDDLHTNLPADLMAFGGTAFPTGTPTFPHHSLVKQYLQSLPHRWGIADCIRTRTSVTNMQKVADGSWEVRCERQDGTPSVVHADFVAVCSGHYSVPFRVELSGKEFFTGRIEHSVDFRSPHAYGDECVVVVGAGPSGMEISAALCDGQQSSGGSRKMVASGPRRVVLSSTRCGFSHGVGGVERRGRVTKVGPGRLVCFGDGPSVEADVIILATGYHYHLPFLPSGLVQILNRATFEGDALDASDESVFVGDASSGVSGRCVWPLLRQCICFNDPSVALIGLPWKVRG